MVDKKLRSQLEKMVQQMSPKQIEKLNSILQNEESLKNAIASIDPKKAKDVVKNLNIPTEDVGKIVTEIKENPDMIRNLDKRI